MGTCLWGVILQVIKSREIPMRRGRLTSDNLPRPYRDRPIGPPSIVDLQMQIHGSARFVPLRVSFL